MTDDVSISKFLTYVLRHAPDEFGLEQDDFGFVDVEGILDVLENKFPGFTILDLERVVTRDRKGRFQLDDDKIRATYGHSVNVVTISENVLPPKYLFHGTSGKNIPAIEMEGLKPMKRQYVHLSYDRETAHAVGLRHSKRPVILRIEAGKAHEEGTMFFKEGIMYLARHIPPKFISIDSH